MKTIVAKVLLLTALLFVVGVAFSVVSGTSHAAIVCHPYKTGGGCWTRVNGHTTAYGHTTKKPKKSVTYVTGTPPSDDIKKEIKATKKAKKVKPVTQVTNNYTTNNYTTNNYTTNNYNTINENTEQDESTLPEQYNNWDECYDYYQVCYDTYDGTMLVDGDLWHCSLDYSVCVKDR